jgi:predicted DNA binding CopG/RHH family protein
MSIKRFVIEVPEDEHRKIKAEAAAQGLDLSTLIRQLLALWLAGKVKVSKPKG